MRWWKRILRSVVVLASLFGLVATGVAPAFAAGGNSGTIRYEVHPLVHFAFTPKAGQSLPSPSQCVEAYGLACYTPSEIRTAYDVPGSLTGAGQTIVIVDAYGSPTVQSDLQAFDQIFNLPDPVLNVIYPGGAPVFNPLQNHDEAGWAQETSLDVQWAHALAPAATIDLVIAANNMGNVLNLAQQYALDHHLGAVMSLSFGADEAAIAGKGNNLQLRQADQIYQTAAQQGVTVFAAAGDGGATDGYSQPNALFPASDPNVTAVGGTDLILDDNGKYQSETVWNDGVPSLCPFGCLYGQFGATGGAPSSIFVAPSYQHAFSKMTARTTADVSYNASVYTAVMVYLGFLGGNQNGLYFFGGTSEGAPQWAAITALANQATGTSQGFLNPKLYAIGSNSLKYETVFHDVTVGNNGFNGPGFAAEPSYDLPTGLGTPDVAQLILALK